MRGTRRASQGAKAADRTDESVDRVLHFLFVIGTERLMTPFFKLLQNVPLLARLSAAQVEAVAAVCQRCSFASGGEIVREGAIADSAYVLIDGRVDCLSTVDGEPAETAVPVGATMLELAMIVDIEANATCIARGPVKILKIPRAALHELMEADITLRDAVIESLTLRLANMAETMREAGDMFDDFRESA